MKTLHISIIIIILSSCSNKRQESKNYALKSQNYFEQKNYKSSDSLCDISIKLDSFNYDAYLLKSKIKTEQKNFYDPIKILKKLLVQKKQTDTLYYLIGQNYYKQDIEFKKVNIENDNNQSLNQAILYYDSSLKTNPYYYKALVGKSNSYHNLKEYENSINILNKSLDLFPDSLKLIFYRGVEKQQLGDKKGSLQDLNSSILNAKLDSTEISTAYRFLSFNYSKENNYDSAIFYISKAINYNSKSYFPYNTRAEYYLLMGKKDLACEDFRKSADLGFMKAYENIKKSCK
jgi:tetratricopeptide (TPR) repeat protein